MKKRHASVKQQELMRIIEEWKAAGGSWPASAIAIADFAVRRGLYGTRPQLTQICARELSRAMRQEHIKDVLGCPVRRLHAARFTEVGPDGVLRQRTLWGDIDTADRDFMEVAFAQRRDQIVGDCQQLSNDVNYYNRRHPNEAPIQLYFDFRDDLGGAATVAPGLFLPEN
jgi:hypothetical protein